jgi:hypothetical protein
MVKNLNLESTPRNMKMRKTPLIFDFQGTFYAKKRLIGVDSTLDYNSVLENFQNRLNIR